MITRGLCRKTFERREKVAAILRAGRRVHPEALRQAVMPDRGKIAFQRLIKGMRQDGYVIECEGTGLNCRGYRLISEPQSHAA